MNGCGLFIGIAFSCLFEIRSMEWRRHFWCMGCSWLYWCAFGLNSYLEPIKARWMVPSRRMGLCRSFFRQLFSQASWVCAITWVVIILPMLIIIIKQRPMWVTRMFRLNLAFIIWLSCWKNLACLTGHFFWQCVPFRWYFWGVGWLDSWMLHLGWYFFTLLLCWDLNRSTSYGKQLLWWLCCLLCLVLLEAVYGGTVYG